ncbi:hypothetical protein FM106_00445 [Brachybacterium faecium]|nr:hypothetical protein FM106_00445 [Brachybacterium faecium]
MPAAPTLRRSRRHPARHTNEHAPERQPCGPNGRRGKKFD